MPPSDDDALILHNDTETVDRLHRQVLDLIAHHEDQTDMRKITAEVPAELYEQFQSKCEQKGRSMSEVLRALVAYYSDDA